MAVGLKHSHYWKQHYYGAPQSVRSTQVFLFQLLGRRRGVNPLLAAMLLQARLIEEDEEELISLL